MRPSKKKSALFSQCNYFGHFRNNSNNLTHSSVSGGGQQIYMFFTLFLFLTVHICSEYFSTNYLRFVHKLHHFLNYITSTKIRQNSSGILLSYKIHCFSELFFFYFFYLFHFYFNLRFFTFFSCGFSITFVNYVYYSVHN